MIINSMPKLSSPFKLIGDSFNIFFAKKNFIFFVSIFLISTVVQAIQIFLSPWFYSDLGFPDSTPIVVAFFVFEILYLIVYILTSVAGVIAVKKVVLGEMLGFKETMSFAWKKMLGFLLLTILVFLITFGGSILLIIPGIIFAVWFSFSKFIFIDQELSIKTSLGKSREIIKGRFWPVFYRLSMFLIFSVAVGSSLSFIPLGLGSAVSTLISALFILPLFLLYKELSV